MRVVIKVDYLCQYDNAIAPGGTCNMTSLAMAMMHYGIKVPGPSVRMPDNLSTYCSKMGWNHGDLAAIQKIAIHFGLADDASFTDKYADIKKHLDGGNLVIVQGYFTPSGHVILVCGYDDEKDEWICNDPAGDWPHYGAVGWVSGEQVSYPSDWFRKSAGPDGTVWAHLLHKP